MRDERQRNKQIDGGVHQYIPCTVQFFHRNRAQRAHRKRLAAHHILLQQEDRRSDDDHDRRHRCREIRLIADLVDELRVDHDGHDVEPLTDQHRRTEVRHRIHEHHECTCENGRCDERYNDRRHFADATAAKTLCCLNQRRIDALHRTGGIEVDEWIELQRQYEQNA